MHDPSFSLSSTSDQCARQSYLAAVRLSCCPHAAREGAELFLMRVAYISDYLEFACRFAGLGRPADWQSAPTGKGKPGLLSSLSDTAIRMLGKVAPDRKVIRVCSLVCGTRASR